MRISTGHVWLAVIIAILLAAMFLGCKAIEYKKEIKHPDGRVETTTYTDNSFTMGWSDGEGKHIELPDVTFGVGK